MTTYLDKQRTCLMVVMSLMLSFVLPAAAQTDVDVKLTLYKVERATNGQEILTPADQVRPGNQVEYRAIYRNLTNHPIKKIAATLPIPPTAMVYLPDTAIPKGVQASLDGQHFNALPLQREVTLPDGRRERREVPASEYRYLRWTIDQLAPGASTTVIARMRLIPVIAPLAAGDKQ